MRVTRGIFIAALLAMFTVGCSMPVSTETDAGEGGGGESEGATSYVVPPEA